METPGNPLLKKHEAVAALISRAFREIGYQVIQYGGATVEQYCRGRYTTGDVDLGFLGKAPGMEEKARVMAALGCGRGVRLFNVRGVLVDLHGLAEMHSPRTVEIDTEAGPLLMEGPEESLVQRILMSVYPQSNDDQKRAALLIICQALAGHLELDWKEARRLAALPGFAVQEQLEQYLEEARNWGGTTGGSDAH